MSLLVVSPAYYPNASEQQKWSGRMVATAQRQGLRTLVYGLGKACATHNDNAQAHDLIPLLEGLTESHILVCDCVDVAFLADEEEIMEKFKSFHWDHRYQTHDVGMVVSAEKDCLCGMPKTGVELGKHSGYFTNLNIGLWIGERKYAIHCLKESIRLYAENPEDRTYVPNSPQAWMGLMLAWGGGPEFALDRNCVLFQSTPRGLGDVVLEGKRLHNIVTDTYPVAMHFNGDKSYVAYGKLVERLLA